MHFFINNLKSAKDWGLETTLNIDNFPNNNCDSVKARANKTNLCVNIYNTDYDISFIRNNRKTLNSIKKTTQ